MLPPEVTILAIQDELPGATEWARRNQIDLDTSLICDRIIRAVFRQPKTGESFYLQGVFDNYRAYPPIWEWYDESWSSTEGIHLSPKPSSRPTWLGNSMFINHNGKGLICAPFNQLAYGAHNGPHSEWGNLAQWMTAGDGCVHAVKIGDMLSAILRDFRLSSDRM